MISCRPVCPSAFVFVWMIRGEAAGADEHPPSPGEFLFSWTIFFALARNGCPGRQAVCLPAPVSLSLPVLAVVPVRFADRYRGNTFPPGYGECAHSRRRSDSRRLTLLLLSTHGAFAETQFLSVQLSRFIGSPCRFGFLSGGRSFGPFPCRRTKDNTKTLCCH